MTSHRFLAPALATLLLGAFAVQSLASPLDTPTVCAGLYQAQAQKVAVSGNLHVPFQWIRRVWTKTEVVLDLQIFWSNGVRLYPGYRCQILPNGTVVPDQNSIPKSDE